QERAEVRRCADQAAQEVLRGARADPRGRGARAPYRALHRRGHRRHRRCPYPRQACRGCRSRGAVGRAAPGLPGLPHGAGAQRGGGRQGAPRGERAQGGDPGRCPRRLREASRGARRGGAAAAAAPRAAGPPGSRLARRWREHLYEMDYLKEGIGLRAMAQRDALIEYEREGHLMFNDMMAGVKEDVVGYVYHLEVQVEKAEPVVPKAVSDLLAGANGLARGAAGAAAALQEADDGSAEGAQSAAVSDAEDADAKTDTETESAETEDDPGRDADPLAEENSVVL